MWLPHEVTEKEGIRIVYMCLSKRRVWQQWPLLRKCIFHGALTCLPSCWAPIAMCCRVNTLNLKISQPQLLLTLGAKRVGSPLWGCPVHYGMFSGILGLQLWIPVPLSHPISTIKVFADITKCPLGQNHSLPPIIALISTHLRSS